MMAPDYAIEGWTNYVLAKTGQLPVTHPADERMAEVLTGYVLPYWLEDGIRRQLEDFRDRALRLVDTPGNSLRT